MWMRKPSWMFSVWRAALRFRLVLHYDTWRNASIRLTDSWHNFCASTRPEWLLQALCSRPFICSSVTKLVNMIFSKMNELILMQTGTTGLHSKSMKRSTLGVRRSKLKVTRGWRYIWRPGGGIVLSTIGSTSFSSYFFETVRDRLRITFGNCTK